MDRTRVPVLLWGDLIPGGSPVTRRTLVGEAAHECMYAWVYLTDHFAIQRLRESVLSINASPRSGPSPINDLDVSFWQENERSKIDPHFQITKDSFHIAAMIGGLLCAAKANSEPIKIVELGQTFFTLIDKVEVLSKLFDSDALRGRPVDWIGIDNSEFANRAARALHPTHKNILLFSDWRLLRLPAVGPRIFTSRFVASYAFPDTKTLSKFLTENFEAVIIEDAFNIDSTERHTQNHGQRQIYLDLDAVIKALDSAGFEVSLVKSYPDHPAESGRCFVVRLAAVKRAAFSLEQTNEFLVFHGFAALHPLADPALTSTVNRLNQAVTEAEWEAVMENKRVNPVWSPTIQPPTGGLKLRLKELLKPAWHRWQIYRSGLAKNDLRGRNLTESIVRFLANQSNKDGPQH